MKLAPEPIHIVRGEGSLLFDVYGKIYIDAISSWWTNIHGHAHPYLAQKIFEQFQQLEHVIFAGFTHTPAQILADRLIQYLPHSIEKIFFSDNGSTSVEVALKMAIQYWTNKGESRKKIIAFEHAYHGDTFGSMSVSDRGVFTKPFHDYLFDVLFIPPPCKGNEDNCLQQFENAIDQNDVAAFIYEPLVMGAGGMLMYEPENLKLLLQKAKSKNIICIADEVMTGFYRTGKLFASEYCNTKPDIICLSKGLTGGSMAMGITACAQFIFDTFYSEDKMKALYHGHSYTANPLACAVANASLDLIELNSFPEQIDHIINAHQEFALKIKDLPKIQNCRQTGTIIAFDIVTGNETNYFNSLRDHMYDYFISHGVLLRPLGNTVYIMPPYCIKEEELNKVYTVILEFLNPEP
jgi:adenosylmethionine-8-amino-7-oxononanoate aminotransferase